MARSTGGREILKHFRITAGDRPRGDRAPDQVVAETANPHAAAFLGIDTLHLRPAFEVAQGDRVAVGQVVFRDRNEPQIAFVAPIGGTVSEIAYGPRRTLSVCVIQADPDAPKQLASDPPDNTTEASVRQTLQSRGMWPSFRTRPFGLTPAPQARPVAIFVNAVQASPLAPDPYVVLAGQTAAFRTGMAVLTRLTDGFVYVSQSQGQAHCPEMDRVETAVFSGTVAAGLVGTQIDRLHRVQPDRAVWSIGYQDVAAIGHLFETGEYRADRIIALTGSAIRRPRLIRATLGTDIAGLCADEGAAARILSGDRFSGRESRFLGRFHDQITQQKMRERGFYPKWIHRLLAAPNAMVPTSAIEAALAPDILPVPLMRALSIGDSEAAKRLGCLSLIEEDLAALTQHCTSGADYGRLLRQVLDDLMKDAA